jgi:hypothetical protein
VIHTDRDDAKDFFIGRITEQAQLQGKPLSSIETRMLKWTEVLPIRDISADELPKIAEEFSATSDDDEFEQRIIELLKAAYAQNESRREEDYRSAYQLLAKEDHYLNVMLRPALESKLRKKFLGIF